jgi:hypothetical protein
MGDRGVMVRFLRIWDLRGGYFEVPVFQRKHTDKGYQELISTASTVKANSQELPSSSLKNSSFFQPEP